MFFQLDKKSGIPLYIQIETAIAALIRSGAMKPLERLPATRELAEQLGVHRNTVVQAYQELEVKGITFSHIGSGTYVSKFTPGNKEVITESAPVNRFQKQNVSFEGLYADHWMNLEDIDLMDIENTIRSCEFPKGIIGFSSVVPDKSLFPLREFQNCTYHALQKYGVDLLEMGNTQGFEPFLNYLPNFLMKRGMRVKSDDVVIVSGIQQGLDLISRIFLNPGDTVVTEELTYRGALRIFDSKGVNVIGIPIDRDGMRVDMMETILSRHRVKMIYTIPTFQNPTGAVMSLERRKQLLTLAAKYQIPVVEDQFANELRLEGEDILPLHSLDESGNVIVVGSFSKILFHGIRLGWVVAPNKEFLSKLILAKKITDWQNNYLIQGAILEFCLEGYFDKYLKRKLKVLKDRRDTMYSASQEFFPEEMICNRPQGGLFSWVDMPKYINAYELLMESKRKGVLFTPKRFFAVHSDTDNGMRLGYISHEPDIIVEGMKILGDLLKQVQFSGQPSVAVERAAAPVI